MQQSADDCLYLHLGALAVVEGGKIGVVAQQRERRGPVFLVCAIVLQRDRGQGLFELEHERLLEVNLNGVTWTKTHVA